MTKEQLKRAKEIDLELAYLNDILYLNPTNDNYGTEYRLDFEESEEIIIMIEKLEDKIVPIFYERKQELEKELEHL